MLDVIGNNSVVWSERSGKLLSIIYMHCDIYHIVKVI